MTTPTIRRKKLGVWFLFCLITGGLLIVYVVLNLLAGRGEILMPLDDVYIHFQYGRQMALGQPYIYNPGHPPTSGATSFIYPYVLAIGYSLGFHDLNLGLWAMTIDSLALLLSIWTIYVLCQEWGGSERLSVGMAVLFGLNGAVWWHVFSGMETALMMLFSLLTLHQFVRKNRFEFIISATLLALTRPEGGLLAGIAIVSAFLSWRQSETAYKNIKRWLWFSLPLLAVAVQPFINLALTGSLSASGNQSKSLFGLIPRDWSLILGRILDNFFVMWREFVTGYHVERDLWFLPLPLTILAFMGLILLLKQQDKRWIGLLILGWFILLSGAISTLDTAFWHFKRYQMPVFALMFPLAGYAVIQLIEWFKSVQLFRWLELAVGGVTLMWTGLISLTFAQLYSVNVHYVVQQPLQMARWLSENTTENAVVAVHDVGMMRYMGNRTTLDMVGLTTPHASVSWRNGPGAVAEFLMLEQPDYIASYGVGHGYGLGQLAETRLYDNLQAEFPVELEAKSNVALAGDYQAIYQPNWEEIYEHLEVGDANFFVSEARMSKSQIIDVVDVANLHSEDSHHYQWQSTNYSGYPSEVWEFDTDCHPEFDCMTVDGARRINQKESFQLSGLDSEQDVILLSRLHVQFAGTIDIYVDDIFIATRLIPSIPGTWMSIPTLIPAEHVDETITVTIILSVGEGYYIPARHEAIQEKSPSSPDYGLAGEPIIASYQDGAFDLRRSFYSITNGSLYIEQWWLVNYQPEGDYRFFVHVYDDLNQPPVAQLDEYLHGLPANWLPGSLSFSERIDVTELSSGTYSLAIGFYQPQTGERLLPTTDEADVIILPDGRLILGEVEVESEAE